MKNNTGIFIDNNSDKELQNYCQYKNKYIVIKEKYECFGCTACVHSCPSKCIEMKMDEEGFLYPCVDEDKCVNCGMCTSVCPYNDKKQNNIKDVYAAINKNDSVRNGSSSGGVFYEVAKLVISNRGVVYGCAWDNQMVARHIRIDSIKDIFRLQGSKYVQSQLDETYKNVKKDLLESKLVLFSGTPCQVSGLKTFLNKDYDKLLVLDVLCHGVPSPRLFKDYVSSKELEFKSKVVDMNLRDKRKSWHRLHTNIKFANGKECFVFSGYDEYMSLFLNNTSLRPSCYNCKFTTKFRQGDITLGDFWGIGKFIFDMDDDKGTSLILVNSDKGEKVWDAIKMNFNYEKTSLKIAEEGNKILSRPSVKNINRDSFYELYGKDGYEVAKNKYVVIPSEFKQKFYNFRRVILDFVRYILHKKY